MAKKESKQKKKHIVVFQDHLGNVLKTSFVSDGESAAAPEIPLVIGESDHYKTVFSQWSHSFAHVSSNMVIKPIYIEEAKKYLVMYFHEDGKLLGMESVPYKTAARQPYRPKKASDGQYDYPFLGWSTSLDSIEGDTNARALFGRVRKSFPVRYFNDDGRLLKEEKVLYGKTPHPPEDPEKRENPTYYYEFAGWDWQSQTITGPTDIYALYDSIYKEYAIRFFEGERMVYTDILHYNDPIHMPEWQKKGYTLLWDHEDSRVRGHEDYVASWEFTNRKHKILANEMGRFQVMNPSISAGTVRCLSFYNKRDYHVSLPKEVKLGDYYYTIEAIGPKCFASCHEMVRLSLPDSVKIIEDYGLASCRRLKEIQIGKGLKSIGKKAFADNEHLRQLRFGVKQIKKVHKNTWDGMSKQVKVIFLI